MSLSTVERSVKMILEPDCHRLPQMKPAPCRGREFVLAE